MSWSEAQASAIGHAVGTGAPLQGIPTLTGAISKAEKLNERLSALSARIIELAQTIGGPFPAGSKAEAQPPDNSAIHALNRRLDSASRSVDEIGEAIAAMSRSLGMTGA